MDRIVDGAIIELGRMRVPLADALQVVLREQIKLVNSGVSGREHLRKHLLKYVGNTLHLLPGHVPISPFKENVDVPAQHLDMKANLALQTIQPKISKDPVLLRSIQNRAGASSYRHMQEADHEMSNQEETERKKRTWSGRAVAKIGC